MIVKNQTITAKANQNQRTFTIRTCINGKLMAKYRTSKMSKEEFDSSEFNTENDWKQFLNSDDYYKI